MFSSHSYMKSLLAICGLTFLLFHPQAAGAVTVQRSIDLVPRWKQSQKYHFQMIKTRHKYQDEKSTLKATTRTDLEIEVLRADKEGYLVRWVVGETRFDDSKLAEIAVEQLPSLLKGMQIIIELDSEATITGVQNWKEIKDSYSKTLDTMTAALRKSGQDNTSIEKIRAQIDSMFATKEQIETLFTREAQLFFLPLGRSYNLSKAIEYEDLLMNPLGGEPIPSRGVFTLKAINRILDRATVTWKQEVDPDEAARVMEKSVKDLAARIDKPVPNEERYGPLIIKDDAEFSIELSSGWVNRLTHTRVVKLGGRGQEDTLEIIKKSL